MPEFQIRLTFEDEPTRDVRNRNIYQQILSDEWTIICLLSTVKHNDKWILHSIELHRENYCEEISVSGELDIRYLTNRLFKKTFSRIIAKGSSFIPIWCNINHKVKANQNFLRGFVKISDKSEKEPTTLAQRESKDIIQMKSLELLSKDFEHLLDPLSSCFTDVNLICGCVSIPAHKVVLSARSPVFAAMFAHPTEENCKNQVLITDIDESVLRALLMYMYSGKTADLTASSAADLLVAADKYQLQDLKAVCSDFLKDTVCPDSVWKILVLGDMLDENLKSFAMDYICHKCGDFSVLQNTQEWKDLRKQRPDFAMDLLESLVKKLKLS